VIAVILVLIAQSNILSGLVVTKSLRFEWHCPREFSEFGISDFLVFSELQFDG